MAARAQALRARATRRTQPMRTVTALSSLAVLALAPALAAGPVLSWMEIRLSRNPGGQYDAR